VSGEEGGEERRGEEKLACICEFVIIINDINDR
jgi:hypothetical protein